MIEKLSNYFKSRVKQVFDQEKYLHLFNQFHEKLHQELNDDKLFEDILKELKGEEFDTQI